MTQATIIKDLSRKKAPEKYKPLFLARLAGRRDYTYSQICISEDGESTTTPWIIGKYENLAEYEGLIYNKVDFASEPIANMVATECEELERMEYKQPGTADNKESTDRLAARIASINAETKEREKQIILHLASLRSDLEMIDAALKHHIQRAENNSMRHILAYWSGVLRAAGEEGNNNLPSNPSRFNQNIIGKAVYEEHFNRVMSRIDAALERRDIDETEQ